MTVSRKVTGNDLCNWRESISGKLILGCTGFLVENKYVNLNRGICPSCGKTIRFKEDSK